MADDDKVPQGLNIADFQNAAKERPEQFQSGLKFVNAVNEGLGGAMRGAVHSAQDATQPAQVLEAAKQGFMTPEQAATWQDIAKRAGVQNKYGLMAAGGLGALVEPTLMPPGMGLISKEAKEAKAGYAELAPTLQTLNKEGKLLVGSGMAATEGNMLQKAAQAESELMAAQPKKPFLSVVAGNEVAQHEAAKQYASDQAMQIIKQEMEAKPHLKIKTPANEEYLRNRINGLVNQHYHNFPGKK